MNGFLRSAVLAAAIPATVQAQERARSDAPVAVALDARVELFEVSFSTGEPLALFVLEQGEKIQEMMKSPENLYPRNYYSVIPIPCQALAEDFEKSVQFLKQELRPISIQIDRTAIHPSIVQSIEKALDRCPLNIS